VGFNYKTGDYFTQSSWVTYLRENGRFLGYKHFPGNYNAIYIYLLGILSYLPESLELYLMKAASCVFDYICAIFSMKIMQRMTQNKKTGLLTYAVILFSPTIFINSGLWGQCDSMHTAFVLMALYFLLNNNIRTAMIYFGVGLSFKLQAVFPLPFIIYFFVYKRISIKNLFYIFIGFFGVSIPAWLFGWPLIKCITNYIAGTNMSGVLTMNAPTIFTWGNITGIMPVIFITAVLCCIGFLIISKNSMPSNNTILLLFLFCNFAIPFFLPNMHERYFYIGEIAVLLYSIANPKRFWISIAVIMPALATYSGYLWWKNPFSLLNLSGVMLGAVIVISKWLLESIRFDQTAQ
jgi:Gpi18-like mannosyltransferase